MKFIESSKAPAPVGPYSQAVQTGNLLFLSGQIAINPSTGELKTASLAEETAQVFDNIKAVLATAELNLNNVVKVTIFMTDLSQFGELNALYADYFGEHKPARETVQVAGLPKDVSLEISVVAEMG